MPFHILAFFIFFACNSLVRNGHITYFDSEKSRIRETLTLPTYADFGDRSSITKAVHNKKSLKKKQMPFLENNVSACKYKEYILQFKIFWEKKTNIERICSIIILEHNGSWTIGFKPKIEPLVLTINSNY